jgi:hypothetical protein
MSDLTPEVLDELERLEREATADPWIWERERPLATVYAGRSEHEHGYNLFGRLQPDYNGDNNLDLVCNLRNHARALIEAARERDRLREEVLRLKAIISPESAG